MRGIILTLAAAVLAMNFGCRDQNGEVYPREQAQASAPRTNLYPLTSPPPGAAQPLQGYAPTRITASYDDGYAAPPPAAGGYAAAPASYGGGTAGYYAGASGQQGGYVASPVGYNPNPAGGPGDPFSGMVQNPFTPNGGVCYVEEITAFSDPNVPIKDPPVLVNQVNVNSPYPGYATTGYTTTTASFTPPPIAGSGYAGGTPRYIPPRLSAATPYGPSGYGGYTGQNQTGIHFGPVEGTADIVAVPSYNAAGFGVPQTPTAVAATRTYAGGAYPAATGTIPATYAPPAPAAAVSAPAAPAMPFAANEIRLVPAPDVPPGIHPNDAGPSQWFEIIRPNNAAIRIGRVSATCVCVGVRVPKRQIAAGERALVEARLVSRPQVREVTYGIYVNIVEPVQTVVDADVTISL